MAQEVWGLTSLAEGSGVAPSTHIVNHIAQPVPGYPEPAVITVGTTHTMYIHAGKTLKHIEKN